MRQSLQVEKIMLAKPQRGFYQECLEVLEGAHKGEITRVLGGNGKGIDEMNLHSCWKHTNKCDNQYQTHQFKIKIMN